MPATHSVFHPLTVAAIEPLIEDAVAITFDVPEELREDYAFTQGQHVNVRTTLAGDDVRRSYSICSPVSSGVLRIAVKRLPGGAFSEHALETLKVGDVVDVMTPTGRFFTPLDPENRKHYVAVAAGSGITPILSIVATTLETEPHAQVTLLYANRTHRTVMFLEEVEDLKDRYPDRFQLVHVLSREPQDVELFKRCGVKYLITTTPVLDGRSFGTNMMEAALVAISGKGRQLTYPEYDELIAKLNFEPQLQELN